jgi:transposase
VIAAARVVLDAGGEVWFADETALREVPPWRAGWSKRGPPATGLSSGRNGRRPILGALNPATGALVRTPRPRGRTDDVLAAVEALGAVRPGTPKLLGGDNASPHMPHRVRDAAREAGIAIAFLPFRSPELMPLEDLWRGRKRTVAANRCYASLDEVAEHTVAWLDSMSAPDRLRRCGLQTSKFAWLPTHPFTCVYRRGTRPRGSVCPRHVCDWHVAFGTANGT